MRREAPAATMVAMAERSVVEWTTTYLIHVVAELTAAGLCADDIERAVEMTLVDLHSAHPASAAEAVDIIRANLEAALAILRDVPSGG